MTDPKTETVWITIPDEATPVSEPSAKPLKQERPDRVRNRVFWGGGFAVLIAFLSLLFAPQHFVGLLQGSLFDGGFKVVPDYETQQSVTLFGGGTTSDVSDSAATTGGGNENVVEAELEAVSIQIEPISDETEAVTVDSESGSVTTTEISGDTIDTESPDIALSSEDSDLLQSLSKQLNDFKEKEQQNEQLIQELMQMLEDQASGMHGSAIAQQESAFPPSVPSVTGTPIAGVYRYNTHTVTVSPYDILAQNKAAMQAGYQADISYTTTVQPYSQQTYNPVLAGVQGQPDTGPAETILFAFAIASLGILVWGSVRAMRA